MRKRASKRFVLSFFLAQLRSGENMYVIRHLIFTITIRIIIFHHIKLINIEDHISQVANQLYSATNEIIQITNFSQTGKTFSNAKSFVSSWAHSNITSTLWWAVTKAVTTIYSFTSDWKRKNKLWLSMIQSAQIRIYLLKKKHKTKNKYKENIRIHYINKNVCLRTYPPCWSSDWTAASHVISTNTTEPKPFYRPNN